MAEKKNNGAKSVQEGHNRSRGVALLWIIFPEQIGTRLTAGPKVLWSPQPLKLSHNLTMVVTLQIQTGIMGLRHPFYLPHHEPNCPPPRPRGSGWSLDSVLKPKSAVGWFLHTAMGGPVARNKNFPARCAGGCMPIPFSR